MKLKSYMEQEGITVESIMEIVGDASDMDTVYRKYLNTTPMENFPRPMGVEGNNYSEEEQKKIDQFAEKSLHLTKEHIMELLQEVFDEEHAKEGMLAGIERLKKTSPTKVQHYHPKESFIYQEWEKEKVREGESHIPGIDPRCV